MPSFFVGLCRRLAFSERSDGYALHGHVIKNVSLPVEPEMWMVCKSICLHDPVCDSVNIGPIIEDRIICELSDSDHKKHNKDMKPQEGFIYWGTEVVYLH